MLKFPELLKFITQEAALLGLFVTAGFILISRDWRSLIMTLLMQYILIGVILARLVNPNIAVLKVMIGAFICPILFLSARQVSLTIIVIPDLVSHGSLRDSLVAWWRNLSFMGFLTRTVSRSIDRYNDPMSTSFAFRLLLVLLIVLVSMTLGEVFPLPGVLPINISTAVYWLILAGLMTLTLTENPMKVGHGLFTALTGFDLYYTIMEQSLLVMALWEIINLLIALVIGYLIIAKGATPEEEL